MEKGMKERTTRSAPCIFCGDVGYDMRIYYQESDTLVHWCHKAKAQYNVSKGTIVTVNGTSYICKSPEHIISIGEFALFTQYLSKEEWMEKMASTDPNWNNKSSKDVIVRDYESDSYKKTTTLSKDESPTLSNRELDERYRYLLSMLYLETKHRLQLKAEWESELYPCLLDTLIKQYQIRSMPPVDKIRFASEEKFNNPFRSIIIKKMIERFGTLEGIPGFYMRSGSYWDTKPVNERWTMVPLEGIIFPCYDKNSLLYRIRIKDDYPDVELKKEHVSNFNGKKGIFHHFYDKDGNHCWNFTAKGESPVIVYGKNINEISLSSKGMPTFGKIKGKYKNISSVAEKMVDGVIVNMLKKGCRSGSPYSLYYTKKDDFKIVIGTEGEKKGMVSNYIKLAPTVSIPGVWCFSCIFEKDETGESLIDWLKKQGMKAFLLCFDADKNENADVKNAEKAFIKELIKHDVVPLIGSWSNKFDKGMDDILLMGIDLKVSRVNTSQ